MNNPLLKNKKTQLFADLQHRTSHYNRILEAKSFCSTPTKRFSLLNHVNSKYTHNIEEERRKVNKKLEG